MIKLINDDCMNVMKDYEDNHFDLAICDPPYGLGEDGAKNHSRGLLAKATKYASKNWDKNPPTKEYFDELIEIDLTTLEPHLNGPFTPDKATPISKMDEEAAKNGWPTKVEVGLICS